MRSATTLAPFTHNVKISSVTVLRAVLSTFHRVPGVPAEFLVARNRVVMNMSFRTVLALLIALSSLSIVDAAAGPLHVNNDKQASQPSDPDGFGSILIADSGGGDRELLFGGTLSASENPLSYALPPVPPAGAFDARFADNTRLIQSDEGTIRVQSSNYPLRFTLQRVPDSLSGTWVIDVVGPTPVTHVLTVGVTVEVSGAGGGEYTLRRLSATGIDDAEVPLEFAVHGNYPSPFSGATTFVMDLPVEALVELEIYDMLGRPALRIPASAVGAGIKRRFDVDATGLAAGLYLYRVRVVTATGTLCRDRADGAAVARHQRGYVDGSIHGLYSCDEQSATLYATSLHHDSRGCRPHVYESACQ